MNFEWDEDKSEECIRRRGFDFAYAAFAFADPDRLIRQDDRFNHGEDRHELIGRIEGRLFFLIYTPRNDRVWIISARKANPWQALPDGGGKGAFKGVGQGT